MPLSDWGWNEFFGNHFGPYRADGLEPARIIREDRSRYLARTEAGEITCTLSGKLRHETGERADWPAVGDWTAARPAPDGRSGVIHAVLPRKSAFSRKTAGRKTGEQVVAANADTVFITAGLDENYNLRRLERTLTLAWNSGARPVILLNKSDLCADAEARKLETEAACPGADVLVVSAAGKTGLRQLDPYLIPGQTVVFLGSSGAGKSTLINALYGSEILKTNSVSSLGSRGRHTTTARSLFRLPGGALVMDTPGMRELQVWGDDAGMETSFTDIERLADGCRFRDCRHENEPGCAVRAAVENGQLDAGRLESYHKLLKEFDYLEKRRADRPDLTGKARWKSISRILKQYKKDHDIS